MTKIAHSLIELIGNTPLVELTGTEKELKLKSKVIAKLEYLNPARSVKDRTALALIERAERKGLLGPATTIIEPTSGNTGIGLAFIAAIRGYRLILTMPDAMSVERRTLLKSLGAELVLTPAYEGMAGAIRKAQELKRLATPISPNSLRILPILRCIVALQARRYGKIPMVRWISL